MSLNFIHKCQLNSTTEFPFTVNHEKHIRDCLLSIWITINIMLTEASTLIRCIFNDSYHTCHQSQLYWQLRGTTNDTNIVWNGFICTQYLQVQIRVNCKEHKIQCTNDNTDLKYILSFNSPQKLSLPYDIHPPPPPPKFRPVYAWPGTVRCKASATTLQYQLDCETMIIPEANAIHVSTYTVTQPFYKNSLWLDLRKISKHCIKYDQKLIKQ